MSYGSGYVTIAENPQENFVVQKALEVFASLSQIAQLNYREDSPSCRNRSRSSAVDSRITESKQEFARVLEDLF